MSKRTSRVILALIVIVPFALVAFFGDRVQWPRSTAPLTVAPETASSTARELHAVFFDVGQGDSFLLRDPDGNDVLVDGGPTDAVVGKLGRYLPPTDRTIELLVLTHPHADHVNGLVEVLRRYEVRRVMMTGVAHGAAAYRALEGEIARQGIPVTVVTSTGAFAVGAIGFETLWPRASWDGRGPPTDDIAKGGGLNDTSIVLRASWGATHLLFMGDASSAIEDALLAASSTVAADLLKVGHHGSRYSSSRAFLAAVQPKDAVIQVGVKNRYGHPTLQTLRRLAEAGATVYRNDTDGDVLVTDDGERLAVSTGR